MQFSVRVSYTFFFSMKKTERFFFLPAIYLHLVVSVKTLPKTFLFLVLFCFVSILHLKCALQIVQCTRNKMISMLLIFALNFLNAWKVKYWIINGKKWRYISNHQNETGSTCKERCRSQTRSVVWLLTIYQLLRKGKYFMNVTIWTNALFKFVFLHRFTRLFFFLLKYHNMTVYCPNLACALLLQAFLFLVFYSHCSVPRN